jgi:hypothetical protein
MHMLRCPCHGLPQEPNIRYLALENLTRLALVPEVLESIREHQVWWNRHKTHTWVLTVVCGIVGRHCFTLHVIWISPLPTPELFKFNAPARMHMPGALPPAGGSHHQLRW